MPDIKERLRKLLDSIQDHDSELKEEFRSVRDRGFVSEESPSGLALLERTDLEQDSVLEQDVVEETIVLRTGRPVLAISHDEAQLVFKDVDSEVWRSRLAFAHDQLVSRIPSVGRIELQNNPRFDWVGTGWLVRNDIVVTNRHVALEFARNDGRRYVFQSSPLGTMSSSIDFLQEIDNQEKHSCAFSEVLHIEPSGGPDIAFLRLKSATETSELIPMDEGNPAVDQFVAVIGYPARDSRIPEQDLMDRTFGNVYNKKRLAPGKVTANRNDLVLHDCSTLGGNSGSVVLSLATGKAVALHFSGRFLEANYAVPTSLVAERLHSILHSPPQPAAAYAQPTEREVEVAVSPNTTTTLKLMVPVTFTATFGTPIQARPSRQPMSRTVDADESESDELFVEGRPEDYSEREGYKDDFLGKKYVVPLPAFLTQDQDVISFQDDDRNSSILRYEHFSVAMSRNRRMCFFSAVNIDGGESRKMKRSAWKTDPRIPKELQIMKECYGNPPKFSRGHMTRREDPIWGPVKEAALGNEDSMHVTNVVPQMQPFNAPIWLGLENYALENARQDEMRISVFTGPFFTKKDPSMYGVRIPISFWKIITFIHDETKKLCATGYTMSQESYLKEEEFVFGQHETTQIPISTIEARSGLGFELLSSVDPMRGNEEAVSSPLTDFAQIRFF